MEGVWLSINGYAITGQTERYDPATGTLACPRYLGTATLLADGTVLVAGGSRHDFGPAAALASAER